MLGTLVAVCGVFMRPIGWSWALGVWAYALGWLPIASAVAVGVRHLVDRRSTAGARQMAHIDGTVPSG